MAVRVYFASLFVNFVFFAPVVETTVSSFTFKDVGIPGMVFTNHSVFDITARNAMRCANQCGLHGDCATFTFTERSPGVGNCRGYSAELNVTYSDMVSETGAQTYSMDEDVCGSFNYTVLDDYRRLENNTDFCYYSQLPDRVLTTGWYRFLVNGTNAVIVDYCVELQQRRERTRFAFLRFDQANHMSHDSGEIYFFKGSDRTTMNDVLGFQCNHWHPIWLDQMNQTLPDVGTEKEGRFCLSERHGGYDDCCHESAPAKVCNCGSFFIYKLNYNIIWMFDVAFSVST